MIQKPKFIDKVQRVKAGALRFAGVSLDGAPADGAYPVDCFMPGLATMHEEDWRQFELTPENALAMVQKANADLAAGKKLRMNYMHDRSGPIAGPLARVELTAEGGVRSYVKWTERAQSSIRAGEWDGTSPEFYARVVLDDKGNPKEVNGRVLMQPFELSGGALDNDPAMPELAIAANTEPQQPSSGKEEPIMETKKLAAMLGLPETATNEECEKALEAKIKTPPATEPPVTVAAVAAAVLAEIKPKELAAEIRAAAVKEATEAFRAETHEKAVVETVDAAIRGGRVKKSERDAALKVAKADLEAFKTMTATMRVVAPVAPIYQAGGEAAPAPIDENDPGNDPELIEAAEKRSKEKGISMLKAAREIYAERQANA